jgi:peptidoglycan/LPS O-acetylase OafA/YrhL
MKASFGSASREILTSDGESRPRYRPDVDGLRAIAILAVVLYHVHVPGFDGGFVGVDIFFVISGFLIGGIVFRDVDAGRYSFATFYARRAKRILPALLCMTFVVTLLAIALLDSHRLRAFARSDLAALLGNSNVYYWAQAHYADLDWRLEPLVMTWSLGVEEQFYLFLPPLMLLLHRFSSRAIAPAVALLSVLSLALSVQLVKNQPSAAFYLLPGRAWELGVGVAVALWQERRRALPGRAIADPISVAALIAIVAAIALFNDDTRFPGVAALLPVIGTAVLIVTAPSWLNRSILATRPMRFIGLVSYSWYLWHWPPLVLARHALGREPKPVEYAVLVLVSFALACASWRFIETPFRRRTAIANVELLKRYGIALLASLGVAGACFAVA